MKVYICGPMRGYPDLNFPAFHEVEAQWRIAGHIAFSPAKTDEAIGYDSKTAEIEGRRFLEHVMSMDVLAVMHSDAIALLPGWQASSGAAVEVALGQFLELEFYDAVTMQRVHPVVKPWRELKLDAHIKTFDMTGDK